jgi:hypothetical protein
MFVQSEAGFIVPKFGAELHALLGDPNPIT